MKIKVNGKEENHNKDKLLADLVNERKLNRKNVIIELNLEIIPQETWDSKQIQEGDSIEIVAFIGGG